MADCQEHIGYLQSHGYGSVRIGRAHVLAHRLAWALHNGADPVGYEVMHTCDNRICVNPEHLKLGSHADNMADMVLKGRQNKASCEDHSGAVLNWAAVYYIRSNPRNLSMSKLGKLFGVAKSTIQNVLEGNTWQEKPPLPTGQ